MYLSLIDAICIYLTPLLILHPSHTHILAKSCFLATALAYPLQNKSRCLVSFSLCQIDTNYRSSWQYHLVSVTVILLTVSVPRKPISVMHFVNYPAAFTPMSCEHLGPAHTGPFAFMHSMRIQKSLPFTCICFI